MPTVAEEASVSVRRTAVLGALLVWLALVWAMRGPIFGPAILETGDLAVNALQIDQAKLGREWYGNYSRFHFHHPGPAFFYVYAAGEYLWHDWLGIVRSPYQAHLLAGLALQATFLTLALAMLAQRLAVTRLLPVLLAVAAGYFAWRGDALSSLWPPYVLAGPFLCFLVAATSAVSGRPPHTVLAVLAGGFLVHGHVAQPLFVGGLAVALVGLALWRRRRNETPRAPLMLPRSCVIWSAALGALFLLPLLLDFVVHGTSGNTATIVRRFLVNTGEGKSLAQALLYVLSFATPARHQEVLLAVLDRSTFHFFLQQSAWFIGWAVVLLGTLLLARRLNSRLTPETTLFLQTAAAGWVLTFVLCVLWGLAQAGPMFHYNGAFFSAVYAWPLLLGTTLALRAIQELVANPRLMQGGGFVVSLLVLTIGFAQPAPNPLAGTPAITTAVETALAQASGDRPKILLFAEPDWPVAASVALALQRRDVSWWINERWTFMFKPERSLQHLGPDLLAHADLWHVAVTEGSADGDIHAVEIATSAPEVIPGETIIDSAINMGRFAVTGLEVTAPEPAWSVLPRAILQLAPQPSPSDVRVILTAARNPRLTSGSQHQRAEVWFAGQLAGTVAVDARQDVSVVVPRAWWNAAGPRATIELVFPDAVRNYSFSRPRSRDAYAWALWSVRFESVN